MKKLYQEGAVLQLKLRGTKRRQRLQSLSGEAMMRCFKGGDPFAWLLSQG